MTREEAIKYFENGINTNLRLKEKDKFATEIANENIEAYSMAISALSEDGEYIKKEDLFNKTIKRNSIWNEITNAEGKGLEEIVNDLPTISLSEKKEEWIPINDIEDIPKSGSYWVTIDYVFSTDVEKIRWSDAWRCWVDYDTDDVLTKESASLIIAYMPYVEPEPPYKGAKMVEPQKSEGIDLTEWTENLIHPKKTGK